MTKKYNIKYIYLIIKLFLIATLERLKYYLGIFQNPFDIYPLIGLVVVVELAATVLLLVPKRLHWHFVNVGIKNNQYFVIVQYLVAEKLALTHTERHWLYSRRQFIIWQSTWTDKIANIMKAEQNTTKNLILLLQFVVSLSKNKNLMMFSKY